MKTLVQEVQAYIKVLDSELKLEDEQIEIVINRIRVYLNRADVPFILAGTIAEIILDQSRMQKKNEEDTISSISDNGQSISFSNKVFQAMTSQKDVDLFSSHTAILNRFRKVGVIGVKPFKNE